jgi:hypothetical protein
VADTVDGSATLMRSWRFLAPVILVVAGLAVLAPLLLLREAGDATTGAGHRGRDAAGIGRPSSRPASSATTSPSASPTGTATSGSGIETTSSTYFGRPFETVRIEGSYPGARRPARLRVEIRDPGGWTPFPLPAVTTPSGQFTAYVEIGGPGRYQLRIVDPERGATSRILEMVVF